jgi:serine/threonine protein kinase/Tfp pilus assembly protein PilF
MSFHTLDVPPDLADLLARSYRGSRNNDLTLTPIPVRRPADALDRTLGCAVDIVAQPAVAGYPRVGTTFLGFELVAELGSGAFGKVFLARQVALAGRPVALKVTTRPSAEPGQLAKLHHTNIVPIYSVHDAAPWQAVCMPYLGARTLADVVSAPSAGSAYKASTRAQATTLTRPDSAPQAVPAERAGARPAADAPSAVPAIPEGAARVAWVLRTLRCLAEGLAHAHGRGILHLDLKPANVLLADDGTPLLLDFNLARDRAVGPRAQVGGTLAYMAPEQLDGFRARDDGRLDERTDLFALGVIAFELLTGRHPFPRPATSPPDFARLAADRRAGAADLRSLNPAVPHAVESIVRTLLQPDPARRYPSSAALAADLTRQLDDRRLAVAPEPSARERLGKWRRRNPRLATRLVTAALVLGVIGLTAGLARHAEARANAVAAEARRVSVGELTALRLDLTDRDDPAVREAARGRAAAWLAAYGLKEGRAWEPTPAFARLPQAERLSAAVQCGEVARLAAASLGANAATRETAESAIVWHDLAGRCYAAAGTPRGFARERADLLAAAGHDAPEVGPTVAGDVAAEGFVAGAADWLAGRYSAATPRLEAVTRADPGHAAAHFLLAACRDAAGDSGRARERYAVAAALDPLSPRAPLAAGGLALGRGNYPRAEAEFAEALRRDPNHPAARRLRAVARLRHGDFAGADADLTVALDAGPPGPALYLLRAQARAGLGDAAGAARDRARADQCAPQTAADFFARATHRAGDDAPAAEADLRRAAELAPRSTAWGTLARLAADRQDGDRALAAHGRAVAANPESAPTLLGRAATLAVQGAAAPARADAARALELADDPAVLYAAARVHALLAAGRPHAPDADAALDLLRAALRNGLRDPQAVGDDPAFAALRDRKEFVALLAAARVLAVPPRVVVPRRLPD